MNEYTIEIEKLRSDIAQHDRMIAVLINNQKKIMDYFKGSIKAQLE